jgi:hypothetical protein
MVTWACTLLLMAYSIAGSMTIGLAFMPSAILLLIAAVITLFIRKDDLRTPAMILSGLAFLLFVAGTMYLLNATVYESSGAHCTVFCDANGQCTENCETTQFRKTLIEENGLGVLVLPIAVTLISAVPLFFALRRSASQRLATWISALFLLAYSIAARFTIGYIFIPGTILLLIVAVVTLFIREEATPVSPG